MNGLSLCSGIGGLDLGLARAIPSYRTVCYVEIEPFCQEILLRRQDDGWLDRAPIWPDLKTFDGRPWRGLVDLIHGGYPCQPFSVAGKRGGTADPRHLWPDIARILRAVEPAYCFFENVAGHLTLGFDVVAKDLEAMGYRVTAGLFAAAEVDAPQKRQRFYILAHTDSYGTVVKGQDCLDEERNPSAAIQERENVFVRANCTGQACRKEPHWSIEPTVGRMVDGIPHRVDRLKALGNAVVPTVAALAWNTLICE